MRSEGGGPPTAGSTVVALVAGIGVAGLVAVFHAWGVFDLADEGVLLAQGARAARGARPYVDFATGYGPLYFRLTGALVWLGGLGAVRAALALVHGATAALVCLAASRAGGGRDAWGVAAVLVFAGFGLVVAPAAGAPFNVPYPSWFVAPLAPALVLLLARASMPRALVAGALAGVAAGLKPNSGLVLAGAVAVALAVDPAAPRRRWPGVLPALALAAFAAGTVGLVWPPTTVAWWALVPPALALVAAAWRHGTGDVVAAPRLLAAGGGFVAVAALAYVPSLATLGATRFAREALLVGSGVAAIYAVAYAWPALLAGAAGAALFAGRRRTALVLALLAAAACLVDAVAAAPPGPAALRLSLECGTLAVVPLLLWAGARALARGAPDVGPVAVAVAGALQLHPRPDVVHLLPLLPAFLPLVAALGRTRGVGAPLAIGALGVLRLLPTLAVAGAILAGRSIPVTAGDVTLRALPDGAPRLQALGAAVEAVRAHTPDDAAVIAFPACALVPFLAGRPTAGPHDYFFPGRPTREEVATLAATFAAAPPPVAVLCDAAGTDLVGAWTAYPEMTALLADAYAPLLVAPPFLVVGARR